MSGLRLWDTGASPGWWVPASPKSAEVGAGTLRLQIPGSLRDYSATDFVDPGREDGARVGIPRRVAHLFLRPALRHVSDSKTENYFVVVL